MQFKYVLLGLVTLTSLHISSGQQCSNGIPGVQEGDVCCDAACETCGVSVCDLESAENDSCCTTKIKDSGIYCSESLAAPCRIDHEGEAVCTNGLPGVQSNSLCCEAQCGTCGGAGCATRPGGEESCCTRRIRDSGDLCSATSAAPCIIDDDNNVALGPNGFAWNGGGPCRHCNQDNLDKRATTPSTPPVLCSNGVPGVETDGICCEAQCGTCGGSGCDQRPGGKSGCCTGTIEDSDDYCSDTNAAPCIVD